MKRQVAIFKARGLGVVALVALAMTGEAVARPEPPVTQPPGRIIAGLEEPLVPTRATSADEDRALDAAIAAFRAAAAKPSPDGSTPLASLVYFVKTHPHSGWNAAVLTNLGFGYYRAGYFGRALDSWQAAWGEGRSATEVRARALVDRAVGELARMHARLGHVDELDRLFKDVGDRPLSGPATETMTGAHEGAWVMRHDPGIAYLCGPNALKNVLVARGAASPSIGFLDTQRSGPHGFSLGQLAGLADRAGLRYRLIHREPGQAVPVPSVVNWNVHHFAAIVGERDGGYLIKDPTFGYGTDELWVGRAAIDSETTGFFLVPADAAQDPGWRAATSPEVSRIYGMGFTGVSQVGANTPGDKKLKDGCPDSPPSGGGGAAPTPGSIPGTGMCAYNAHTMLDSLNLNDTPVGYAPAKGPSAYIRLTYNQREASQPATFSYFNVGAKWTLNVLSFVQDNPAVAGSGVVRYVAGGGSVAYPTNGGPFSAATGAFAPEAQTQAVLVRIPASGAVTSYELRAPDGSKQVFALLDGATTAPRRVFLTKIVDPAGNALSLDYDGQLRLTSITDATGRNTTFAYELADDPLRVTRITDPFGRSAVIGYLPNGQLGSITDVIGMTSSFTYDAAGLVNSMTTPYGTTQFSYGQNAAVNSRFLEIADPMGFAERLEFMHQAPGIALTDPVAPPGVANTFLFYRNSFFWDKHVLPIARPTPAGAIDYTKASISHWLHTAASQTSPTLESTKSPLENRVWYTYPSQPTTYFEGTLDLPTSRSRVLDDRITSQTAIATYNAHGKPLSVTDPRGRKTVFTYDPNGIDLLTIAQQVSPESTQALATLSAFTYNTQHLPLSASDASGQTVKYAYNPAGQIASVTDPLGHITSHGYDNLGRLTTITDPNGTATLAITYDAFDRVATRTDALGYVLAYEYDALDRLTKVTYPDGTSEQYAYDKLDLVSRTDRRGQTTSYAFDADRRRTSMTDPLGHVTKFDYYENGTLKALTDPNGNTTTWDIDLQSRPTAKHYANGTTETVKYEATTSRVASVTDAAGQSTAYTYDVDDRVTAITYNNALQPTASVQFEYDPVFPRPIAMTDGNGTTIFTYNEVSTPPSLGANRLRSIENPVAGSPAGTDTVTFVYDELGRVTGQTVNGALQTAAYDALGRVATLSNPLDSFTYGYADSTARPTTIASSHGPQVALSYLGASGDELLQQLTYTPAGGGAPLAQFGYAYDPNHNVTSFTRQEVGGKPGTKPAAAAVIAQRPAPAAGAGPGRGPVAAVLLSALAGLLLLAAFGPARTRRTTRRFAARASIVCYLISCGGDASTTAPEMTTYGYDNANHLLTASVGESAPSSALSYSYDAASNITSMTSNGMTKTLGYTAINDIAGGTYDANGSPSALDGTSYVWDAANRLVAVVKDGSEADFTYDGLSRLVRIVEKRGATTIADHAYTWCGRTRCLEHDNTLRGSPVSKQYFAQGVIAGGDSMYYIADSLGSVRQLIDATGKLRAQYSYDPYGNASKLAGDLDADIGYAGYFHHASSGLDFALYRPYDAAHGRWLNRDPLRETAGANLYSYVGGNPTNAIDPSGLLSFHDIYGDIKDALSIVNGASASAFLGLKAISAAWKAGVTQTASDLWFLYKNDTPISVILDNDVLAQLGRNAIDIGVDAGKAAAAEGSAVVLGVALGYVLHYVLQQTLDGTYHPCDGNGGYAGFLDSVDQFLLSHGIDLADL